MKLAVLLVVALAAASVSAKQCPATIGDLHATFTELDGHGTCQRVTGTCQPGYTQNPKGAPTACCSDFGNWKHPENPCIKTTSSTKPAPTSTKPAPTTTKPAPTTTKPAPTTTKPAPTTTKPAPTTTKPAPTSTKPAPTATSTKPAPTATTKPTPKPTNKPMPIPSMAFAVSAVTTYIDELDSICAGVSFDRLTVSSSLLNNSITINSQDQMDGETVGDCPSFSDPDPKTKQLTATPSVKPNFNATVDGTPVLIEMSFLFNINGTYTADQVFNKTSGNGAAFIRQITIDVTDVAGNPIFSHSFTTKNLQKYLSANQGTSLQCERTTSFNETTKDGDNVVLTLENYSIEAVTPKSIHDGPAPVGGTDLCPVKTTSASKTGLVIGAIVGALAVLGILLFVYTRCKSERDGYQSLDAVQVPPYVPHCQPERHAN